MPKGLTFGLLKEIAQWPRVNAHLRSKAREHAPVSSSSSSAVPSTRQRTILCSACALRFLAPVLDDVAAAFVEATPPVQRADAGRS